jgi:hypothetical protein
MGNVHSLSSGAVLAGIVIVGGVVYYSYVQSPPTHTARPDKSTSQNANKKGKKKNTKKSTSSNVEADTSSREGASAEPIVVAFPTVLPGQFDAELIVSNSVAA